MNLRVCPFGQLRRAILESRRRTDMNLRIRPLEQLRRTILMMAGRRAETSGRFICPEKEYRGVSSTTFSLPVLRQYP
jgi:hypothetical protein